MSRTWNKNTIITREQLIEKYNIADVDQYGWTTKDGKHREPTVSAQFRKDGKIGYVVCQVSLYGGKSENYLRLPFSKMVYAWHHGQTSVDKVIDHINQNPLDCRIENLREVDEFWNTSKNARVWNWPQSKYFVAKERKAAGITYPHLVKAMNEWIKEAQEFYEKAISGENNLFSSDEAK